MKNLIIILFFLTLISCRKKEYIYVLPEEETVEIKKGLNKFDSDHFDGGTTIISAPDKVYYFNEEGVYVQDKTFKFTTIAKGGIKGENRFGFYKDGLIYIGGGNPLDGSPYTYDGVCHIVDPTTGRQINSINLPLNKKFTSENTFMLSDGTILHFEVRTNQQIGRNGLFINFYSLDFKYQGERKVGGHLIGVNKLNGIEYLIYSNNLIEKYYGNYQFGEFLQNQVDFSKASGLICSNNKYIVFKADTTPYITSDLLKSSQIVYHFDKYITKMYFLNDVLFIQNELKGCTTFLQ